MSRLITISIIVILIIALSISGIFFAKNTKEKFYYHCNSAVESCNTQNSDRLLESAKKMSALFESRHGFLSFFVRHDEIERLETLIISLLSYAKTSSYESAVNCIYQIEFLINHIYVREIPNLDNLF